MIAHKGTKRLDTERLCLRRYAQGDAVDIFKNYATDAEVTKFLSWPPYERLADLESFIGGQIASYDDTSRYVWVIQYQGEVIGSISVTASDEQNAVCEIGYCMGRAYWGKGFMTEALRAVLRFLFMEVDYHRIYAKHDVENPASCRVMEKSGMAYEGRLRGYYHRGGEGYSDALLYAILREDFS